MEIINNPSDFVNEKNDLHSESQSPSSLNGNSNQRKNGYTKVPHFLIEELIKRNFSEYESRVLWKIIRETYGWHRKEADITYDDFEKGTGLRRYHVWRTISRLVKRNLVGKKIIKTSEGRKAVYWINEDSTEWRDISPQGDISPEGDNPVSCQGDNPVSYKGDTEYKKNKGTKEREKIFGDISYKGDTTESKELNPKTMEFLDWYQIVHKEKKSHPYPVMKNDYKLVDEMLQIFPLDDLKKFAERLLTEDDPFVKKAGCSIRVFQSQLPRLASTKKKVRVGSPEYYREAMKQYETADEGASEESQTEGRRPRGLDDYSQYR